MNKMTNIKENNKGNVIANAVKQSHDANDNNQQIASSLAMTHARVPKLRFKEFEGDWEKKKLNSINIKVIDGDRGKNYPNGNDFSEKGYCMFLNAKNVTKKGFSFEVESFITEEKDLLLRKGKLERYDIVLTTRGSVGHVAFYDENIPYENLRINSGMVLIRTDSKFVRYDYLNKYFNSNQIQNEIKKISFGSAQPQLTVGEIVKFKIAFPNLPEQQKIANFLTVVDTKLQQLTTKKETLAQYKKGVMQQLFSQQLRFKDDDGCAFADWEKVKLGSLTKIIAGGTPRTTIREYWNGNIRWMNSGELNLKKVYEVENRITELGLKKSSTSLIPKYSILIGLAGQGKTRGTVAMNMVELCTNQSVAAILPNEDKICSEFIFQNLDSRYDEIRRLSTGDGGRGGLNLKIIKSIKMSMPCVLEQQKIANYLSAIDLKIEAVQMQITKTQAFKKGLLQQMFV